ncbi:MAG: S41 family peptidase [Anaerolineae bacterium]
MTRRILIVVGVLAIVTVLTVGAFGGGFLIGRLTGRTRETAIIVTPEVTAVEALEETEDPPSLVEETITPQSPSVGDTPPVVSTDFDYELVQEVLGLLEEQFYGELPDRQALTYGAIRGMLLALDDPYTSFIDPQITAILNEDASGTFEGIGAMVTMREDGYLEIASLIPGQPAEAAGVLPGDIILAVGDQSIVGLGLYEAISYIRGPAGTDAVLTILRADEEDEITITVTRARIEVPVVEYRMLDDGIGYILLTEFDANATDRVQEALEELLKQNPKGLIFDLRSNPGGWLDQSIKVSDLFLSKGLVAIERDSAGGEQRFYSYNGDIGEDIPMVVLVNRGSASASEIVAGALQDRDRAVLIGTKTLGKGSVQRPNAISDGSQLRVTIARWFTPDDNSIHGDGLEPDVLVEISEDTPADEDPQLERAIEYLLQGQ